MVLTLLLVSSIESCARLGMGQGGYVFSPAQPRPRPGSEKPQAEEESSPEARSTVLPLASECLGLSLAAHSAGMWTVSRESSGNLWLSSACCLLRNQLCHLTAVSEGIHLAVIKRKR